jgi:hypothetical protein
MTRLRAILRRLILTADERATLERAEVFRRWQRSLDPIERDVVQTLRNGARAVAGGQPVMDADEAKKWGGVLASPVGRKVDLVMHDLAAGHAQEAMGRAGEQLQHACGFARGYFAAWHMAKTLSRIANTEVGTPEPDADTADAGLEQHQP